MHLRNRVVVSFVGSALLAAFLFTGSVPVIAQQDQIAPPAGSQGVKPTPLPKDVDPNDPALPVWLRPANPTPIAASTPATATPGKVGPSSAANPAKPDILSPGVDIGVVKNQGGNYTIRVQSEEVTLPVTVMDQKRRLVTSLAPANFEVYEDGQVQHITSFRREDIPVSIGIVVDNSGSMRTKRAAVTKAVVNLVQASNPHDEVFIVNFNDEPYLDQDFTSKVDQMREALDRVDSRGGTALYDAVIASADHLAKGGQREKKVLLVVTDGDDNESRESLEQAVRTVANEKGPTIYAIGILSTEDRKRTAKRALEALTAQTGGVAFFPKDLQEVDEISQEVARDIRNQYTLTYKPTNPRVNGGYRQIRVVAHEPGSKDNLVVRTRNGYFANEQQSTTKQQN